MVKPEWGTKRTCPNCGARFYDMRRNPIVCPTCQTTFEPEVVQRGKRARPAPAEVEPVAAVPEEVEDVEADAVDDADEDVDADDEEDEALLEDASDLGDDDVGDVIEHVESDDEDR